VVIESQKSVNKKRCVEKSERSGMMRAKKVSKVCGLEDKADARDEKRSKKLT
jgi:hypothetical protein